ncbi:MAG: D-galactonate dehydratase family protein [Rhodospirillales bacterium]|jgi:mannonate dehydratase|nr:D-galactonate dehydratase family protein [Rhodospirillales bacterium]
MKISAVKVFVCCPGRNYVTVRVETDEGIYGLGDATLNGREKSVVSYLQDHVAPCLIGRDAGRIEDIWQYLYRGVYWRRGPVTMAAIGAIDVALWDIKAKAAGMPLYQLLGGACRDRVRAYCHAFGEDASRLVDTVQAAMEDGFTAVRLQSGIRGLEEIYGVVKNGGRYEPADASLPREMVWDTAAYMNQMPAVFEFVRKAVGEDVALLHDVHHRLSPMEAARFGKDLEPYRPFWMEDPLPCEDQDALSLVRAHTTTPIAVGEVFNSIHDCNRLIANQQLDYLRVAVSHGGGITALRRMAAAADLHHVRMACHGPSDVSPVAMAASLHFDLSIHNFGIQEFMGYPPETKDAFTCSYALTDGFLHPGEVPGLGVTFHEETVERYPYKRAYLPVTRLRDGTLWDW